MDGIALCPNHIIKGLCNWKIRILWAVGPLVSM
jgi:hypothetical protein